MHLDLRDAAPVCPSAILQLSPLPIKHSRHLLRPSMSASSDSVFQVLFQAACKEYESRTGTNFIEHTLAIQLQTCTSFESLISLLRGQARAFHEFRWSNGKVITISLNHACMSLSLPGFHGRCWELRWVRQSVRVHHGLPSPT